MKLWYLQDPKSALCNHSSELRPSNISHDFTYPADLFRTLQLDTKWTDDVWWSDWSSCLKARKSDWKHITWQMNELRDCPAALEVVEELNVQTQVPYLESFASDVWSNPDVPVGVPDLFVDLLTSTPNLRKLDWTSFGDNDAVFRETFAKANLTLPNLRQLSHTSGTEFLVGICPAVESIDYRQSMRHWYLKNETHPTMRLLHSLGSVPDLKSFSIYTALRIDQVEGKQHIHPHQSWSE